MSTVVDDYVAELRRELADLPAAEVDEIVEDLAPQLAEIEAEGREPLGALGAPAEYAAELRGAAGLSTVEPKRGGVGARFAVWVLAICTVAAGYGGYLNEDLASNDARFVLPAFGALLVVSWFVVGRQGRSVPAIADLAEVRLLLGTLRPSADSADLASKAFAYLISLRPGWFLFRACLAGLGALAVCRTIGWYRGMPELVALGVTAVVLVAGYRSLSDRRWLWLSVPAGGWAVGVGLSLLDWLPFLLNSTDVYGVGGH